MLGLRRTGDARGGDAGAHPAVVRRRQQPRRESCDQPRGLQSAPPCEGGRSAARSQNTDSPVFAVACETDHIAAWKGSFAGFRQFGTTDKTFTLSQSGHIAGIINPPSKGKYGHYTNETDAASADAWKAGATFHDGSWWPRWGEWLASRSGAMVKARPAGDSDHPALAPAPGTYVAAVPAA